MKITLESYDKSHKLQASLGTNKWMFIFGPLAPLANGDLQVAIECVIWCAISIGASWLIYPFIYNKQFIVRRLREGYKPATDKDKQLLRSYGIL